MNANRMLASRLFFNQGSAVPYIFRKKAMISSRTMSSESVTGVKHLTVPPLAQTLSKFLHSVKPLLSADQYQHACRVVYSFIYLMFQLQVMLFMLSLVLHVFSKTIHDQKSTTTSKLIYIHIARSLWLVKSQVLVSHEKAFAVILPS